MDEVADIRMGWPATTVAKYTKREPNQPQKIATVIRWPKLSMMSKWCKPATMSRVVNTHARALQLLLVQSLPAEGRDWEALLLTSPWHEVGEEELMNHESGVYLPGVERPTPGTSENATAKGSIPKHTVLK